MKYFIFLIVLLVSNVVFAGKNVSKGGEQKWVNQIEATNLELIDDNGGYQYYLIDYQNNISKETLYSHFVIKILNAEGIQSNSDVTVSFDPSYQKVIFHKILINRGGKIIKKLGTSEIKLLQRETSLERSLYDGSLSAVINLTDVRENDIIDYSYSVVGFNPIKNGNYYANYYQQYSVPVNRIYTRLVIDEKDGLEVKTYNEANEPVVKKDDNLLEYIWDNEGLDAKLYDNNVPNWYDPCKRVSVSTISKWTDVVNWALPLYQYSEDRIQDIDLEIDANIPLRIKIMKLIRLVQDEVRYLGFESGINAFKPHNPLSVWNQRYGDCKDKSLLLVSLLRKEGVESHPLLVNSVLKSEVQHSLPNPNVFDHCIVQYKYKGKNYFVDPTIANQGGDVDNLWLPNYSLGLLIKPGEKELISIPNSEKGEISIKEVLKINSIGGVAELTVFSKYKGSRADRFRKYFNTNSFEFIQKEYLNFYSSLYPGIEVTKELTFLDDKRDNDNVVSTKETYLINDFWIDSEKEALIYFEIYPLVLEGEINYTKSPGRSMPYYMGSPFLFTQTTKVHLPEVWNVSNTDLKITGDGFDYENRVLKEGKVVSVTNKYELSKEYVSADSVFSVLKKHKEIKEQLNYVMSYSTITETTSSVSWLSVFFVLVLLVLTGFFAFKLYSLYDPMPRIVGKSLGIGGWLILLAVGLTLSPILLLVQVVNEDYFSTQTWVDAASYGDKIITDLQLILGLELIFNIALIVYTILVVVLFYKKRTSAPLMISILYVVSFLGSLGDVLLIEYLIPDTLLKEDLNEIYKSMMRVFISAAIWIPYLYFSDRAKATFSQLYRKKE